MSWRSCGQYKPWELGEQTCGCLNTLTRDPPWRSGPRMENPKRIPSSWEWLQHSSQEQNLTVTGRGRALLAARDVPKAFCDREGRGLRRVCGGHDHQACT